MKVAFYVRVATRAQVEDGESLAKQVSELTAWADQEGHEVVQTYRDLGASGNDVCRPELCRLMADAASSDHPFDAVAVTSLSKFFRDVYNAVHYEKQLQRVKVKLVSISQPSADDKASQMVRTVLASFDEYRSGGGRTVRRSMTSETAAQAIGRKAKSRNTRGWAHIENSGQPNKDASS
jgi:site-specific DNA recombinase